MAEPDLFDLRRFVEAQRPVFDAALAELTAGRKRSHWMWFVFPQLRGLGSSPMATLYGLSSIDEARAYLRHPELGPRLKLCAATVLEIEGRSLNAIFGSPDDMKFVSSMTLFAIAQGGDGDVFRRALDRFNGGRMDERTLSLLGA